MYPYHTVTGNTALCITANFPANVSVGSDSDLRRHAGEVCFTLESRHSKSNIMRKTKYAHRCFGNLQSAGQNESNHLVVELTLRHSDESALRPVLGIG
jgi:hypothetical protein